MSTDTRDERLARRISDLYATDPQFAAAKPDPAVSEAIEQPGLPLAEIVRTVMEGYADRPALGERAVEFISDPQGRTTSRLLPHFDTITYRELWDRVNALTSAVADVHPGDRVAILGFASVDYTVIDMATIPLGAVSVPLQTSAPITSLRPIVTETEPALIASSIDYVDDAVELVLTGHTPNSLIVFDYHPEITDHREAYDAARAQLAEAGSPVVVETLQDLLERGKTLPARPVAARRRRRLGAADLHIRQHRRAEGRDLHPDSRR